jgi:hypothetical protein
VVSSICALIREALSKSNRGQPNDEDLSGRLLGHNFVKAVVHDNRWRQLVGYVVDARVISKNDPNRAHIVFEVEFFREEVLEWEAASPYPKKGKVGTRRG